MVQPLGVSSPTRRLTTVWFADIAGFTKLSATDEPLALRAMEAMRRCVRASVAAYHGTIIKFLGDGALAEFPSAEGAVEAALEAVARFKGGTKELAGGPYLLHIGIHVGDVTVASDGDLFGDGVNRAARLQSLGQGGQVLVSEDVFRLVRRRAELKFDALGEKTAKELEDPFEVFAVEPNGEMVERLAQMEDDPANRAPAAVQRTRQARVQRVRPSRAIGTGIAAGVVAFVGLALYTAMGGQADPVVVVTPMPDGLPLPIHTASFAMPAWPPRAAAVRQAAATDPAAPAPNTLAGLARRGEAYLARLRGRDMAGYEVLPLLRQALNEARDGAPAGARADVIRAVALFVVEQDGRRSEAAFQQALAADPQAGLTRLLYARLLTAQGRSGEARFQIEQAKGKGVSNAAVNAARGALLLRDGQFRQAQGPLADALDNEDLLSTRHPARARPDRPEQERRGAAGPRQEDRVARSGAVDGVRAAARLARRRQRRSRPHDPDGDARELGLRGRDPAARSGRVRSGLRRARPAHPRARPRRAVAERGSGVGIAARGSPVPAARRPGAGHGLASLAW